MTAKTKSFAQKVSVAYSGIAQAWRRESSMKVHSLAAISVMAFCLIARPPLIWCALFVAMCGLVLALELVNSAIEAFLDRIHPAQDSEIGFVKDCLAGAVLVASIASVIVFGVYLFSIVGTA